MTGYGCAWVPGNSRDAASMAHAVLIPLRFKYSVTTRRLLWQQKQHPKAFHKGVLVFAVRPDPNMAMIQLVEAAEAGGGRTMKPREALSKLGKLESLGGRVKDEAEVAASFPGLF